VGSNPASPTITVDTMCGRFVGSFSTDDILNEMQDAVNSAGLRMNLPDTDLPLLHNFNVAPTHAIPILRVVDGVVEVDVVQWGLLPIWSKDASKGASMINARSETITEKPSFKGLVPGHRCIIPMSGFYEWDRSNPKAKIPYYVTRADGHLMLGAGIWSDSPIVDAGKTCALITRDSIFDLSDIHDRSPVEFHADEAVEWLLPGEAPLELFQPDHQPRFRTTRVSTRVNSVRNNDETLIQPDDGEEEKELTLF
jgi:putative SOS response-associated peptidase YedK